jgi:hypothetical protein
MKKIVRLILVLIYCLSIFPAALAQKVSLESLNLDLEAYKDYLSIIKYAVPMTATNALKNNELLEKNLNKRVTILGFVKPEDGKYYFTKGKLYSSVVLEEKTLAFRPDNYIEFEAKEMTPYKPFEVYQITGNLGKNGDKYTIKAEFAEPQDVQSQILFAPDFSEEVKKLPNLDWNWETSYIYDSGKLVATDVKKIELPEQLKKLDQNEVSLKIWILDKETQPFEPATNSRYISLHSIAAGKCLCCGYNVEYNYSNTALIKLKKALPPQMLGGTFIGKVHLNPKDQWLKNGFFTLEDAYLVEPQTMPYLPPPPKKIKLKPKQVLPALKLPGM